MPSDRPPTNCDPFMHMPYSYIRMSNGKRRSQSIKKRTRKIHQPQRPFIMPAYFISSSTPCQMRRRCLISPWVMIPSLLRHITTEEWQQSGRKMEQKHWSFTNALSKSIPPSPPFPIASATSKVRRRRNNPSLLDRNPPCLFNSVKDRVNVCQLTPIPC